MKVLLGHTFYRYSGGEDAVYYNERQLLEKNGVEVVRFVRSNNDIDTSSLRKKIEAALNTIWSRDTYQNLSKIIKKTKPDIAHFHNTFPLISPSAYAACQDNGVPVVQTLHNYRLICPGALLYRDSGVCSDCVGRSLFPALKHRCFRDSLPATTAVAAMLYWNRRWGTYKKLINRYIVLTEFAVSYFVRGGIPEERIVVKPNVLSEVPHCGEGRGSYAVYVGRLSKEKGVVKLLAAWEKISDRIPLKIIGDGPLLNELKQRSREKKIAVDFLGFLPKNEVQRFISESKFLIVPSEWYEGFPMVVLESYACGTPVIASRIGGLDEIVIDGETGVKFEVGDEADLASKVLLLLKDPLVLKRMRKKARARYDIEYSEGSNFRKLMDIYRIAIKDLHTNR